MKNRITCLISALLCALIAYFVVFFVELDHEIKGVILYVVMCVCIYTVYVISQIAKAEERNATQEWLDRFGGE
jgi:membrane protein DedA with SNARE-associated domain